MHAAKKYSEKSGYAVVLMPDEVKRWKQERDSRENQQCCKVDGINPRQTLQAVKLHGNMPRAQVFGIGVRQDETREDEKEIDPQISAGKKPDDRARVGVDLVKMEQDHHQAGNKPQRCQRFYIRRIGGSCHCNG